jgi:hypothetical protein
MTDSPRPKRASKRALRLWAALAGAGAFALPWVAIRAIPAPVAKPAVQVVTLPAGTQLALLGAKGRVKVVAGPAAPPPPPPEVRTR